MPSQKVRLEVSADRYQRGELSTFLRFSVSNNYGSPFSIPPLQQAWLYRREIPKYTQMHVLVLMKTHKGDRYLSRSKY